jgi:hypothetical protein
MALKPIAKLIEPIYLKNEQKAVLRVAYGAWLFLRSGRFRLISSSPAVIEDIALPQEGAKR